MDDSTFNILTRALTVAGSRRLGLCGPLASLGLLGRTSAEDAAAHDLSKKCKKKSGNEPAC
jgi:hypothetical protein